MTATDMWNQLVERHPSFAVEENLVSLRARGLHALIQQAWDEGHAAAVRKNADLYTGRSSFEELFPQLFKN